MNSGKSKSTPGTAIFLPDSTISIVCGDGNSIILEEISSRLIPPAPPVIFFEIFFNRLDINIGKLDFRWCKVNFSLRHSDQISNLQYILN